MTRRPARSGRAQQRGRIDPLAAARGLAYARDCAGYLGIAVAEAVPGGFAAAAGVTFSRGAVTALSAVAPVVATCWAAAAESGPRRATWGKARGQLDVVSADPGAARLTFGRALVRNAVKIGIPWQLGHLVALGAAWGDVERGSPVTLAAAVVTYPLLALLIGSVVLRPGRGIHDRLAGSRVIART